MNNTFKLERFEKLVRLQFMLGWRKMALGIGSFAAMLSTIYFLANRGNIFANSSSNFNGNSIDIAQLLMCLCYAMLVAYIIIKAFKPYFRRGSAAAQVLIPASGLEKYTLNLLYVVIIAPVVLFCIVMLTDAIWIWIIKSATDIENASGGVELHGLASRIFENIGSEYTLAYSQLSFVAAEVAFMLLLATIYRRHTLLMSLISIAVVHIILSSIHIQQSYTLMNPTPYDTANQMTPHILETVMVNIVTMALIYLSWRRFSRLQITK